MPIIFPQTPDPLHVNLNNVPKIKHTWLQLDLKKLEIEICSYLLKVQKIPKVSHWHRSILTEEYQIPQILQFFDVTIPLLKDLHKPKVNALHTQMLVQISNINSRIFQIGQPQYTEFGECLTKAMRKQLGRDKYDTEMELVWTKFYSDLANLMLHHAKEPLMEFVRSYRQNGGRKSSQVSSSLLSASLSQKSYPTRNSYESISEYSNNTSPSGLSLNFDTQSALSFHLEFNEKEHTMHHGDTADHFDQLYEEKGSTEVQPNDFDDIFTQNGADEDEDDAYDLINSFAPIDSSPSKTKSEPAVKRSSRISSANSAVIATSYNPSNAKTLTSAAQAAQMVAAIQRLNSGKYLRSKLRSDGSGSPGGSSASSTRMKTKSDCVIV